MRNGRFDIFLKGKGTIVEAVEIGRMEPKNREGLKPQALLRASDNLYSES